MQAATHLPAPPCPAPAVQSRRRRAGVPQFPHVHVLLMGGLHAAEKLLPGITQQVLPSRPVCSGKVAAPQV